MEPFQLTPGELAWRSFPSLPAGAQVSVLFGDPEKDGPFVLRARLPPNYRAPPHSMRDDSTMTVLSGTLYRGTGDRFDEARLEALPAGSFALQGPEEMVFLATRDEEAVVEIHGRGPLAPAAPASPADDPRAQASAISARRRATPGGGPNRSIAPRDRVPLEATTAARDDPR